MTTMKTLGSLLDESETHGSDKADEDEDQITETTVMLEMEEGIENTAENDKNISRGRGTMSRVEFWARGGMQESCAKFGDAAEMCNRLIIVFSWLFMIVTFPFSLLFAIKWTQEYERAVVYRLGLCLDGALRGPGIFFIVPCIDTFEKIDMRTQNFIVPPQDILTKDSVTVYVNAVMYYRVADAESAVNNVDDYAESARLIASTTLRNVLGTKTLGSILSGSDAIAKEIKAELDLATTPWGVQVERVEVKDVSVPEQLQRSLASEAEARRNARAKVIAAEGELQASKSLAHAARTVVDCPQALQLRFLQTLNNISEDSDIIMFPLPLTIISWLTQKRRNRHHVITPSNSHHQTF